MCIRDRYFDKVWYVRHLIRLEKESDGQAGAPSPEIQARASAAARAIEERYGPENIGPWDDWGWGFVNGKLFPYLHGFKQKATGPDTIEYKVGEIFGELKNRIQSGYNLRDVIDHIDELRFASQAEKHELSHLYEAKIKNLSLIHI